MQINLGSQGIDEKLQAIFDWIEFTIHNNTVEKIITETLKLKKDDFVNLPKGKIGYTKQKIWNEGSLFILYNEDEEKSKMGVHIILSGSGCRQYEKNKNIRDLILCVSEHEKFKFTRIDIAIDDREGKTINFDRFLKESNKHNFSSLWYKWSCIMEKRIADGQALGRTIYYGSKSSQIFMRVYDKHLEQQKKQKKKREDPPEPMKENINWTRLEIVFREKRAELAATYLASCNEIGRLIRGVLKQYIRFLEKPKDSKDQRKRRWKTASWWDKLIGEVEKIKLTIKPAKKSIEDMKSWVEKQIFPTIAAITTANEGDMDWLIEMIIKGRSRLKTKHIQAIQQHLNG